MENHPSYNGSGLVNLVAEIEQMLGGSPPAPGLAEPGQVPDGRTVVLVLFDGLGVAQLDHPEAALFRSTLAGELDAPFPTTTNVSLSTIATGLEPSRHGQIGHLTWLEDLGKVVNTLKWVSLDGQPVPYDYAQLLPRGNLWERLRSVGIEPITVQPGDFEATPLTRMLYRGARFEGAWDEHDLVEATVSLSHEPGRLIFTYVPFVDFAGHVFGLDSGEFTDAMKLAAGIWEGVLTRVGPDVTVIATADHGLLEVSETDKILIRDPEFDELRFAGDTRSTYVWGEDDLILRLSDQIGATLTDPLPLLGPSPSDATLGRVGEKVLLAPDGKVVLPKGFDKRLRAYHGGLSDEELKIPLLVG